MAELAASPTAHLRRRVRRGLAWGLINSVTMRFASLAVGIVLARLLTPEAFGAFAVALVVQTILMNFADLGISADLIRNPEWQRRVPTVSTISLMAGIGLSSAMILAAPLLASSLGSRQAAPAIAVMSISLVIVGTGVAPFAAIQRNFQQSRYFVIVATSFLLGSGVTIALIAVAHWGVMALAVGNLVQQSSTVALQYALTHTKPRFGFDRAIARSALAFGLPVCGANALSWLVLNVDYVVIGHTAGSVTLGFYVLAFNISSWPVNALLQAVRNVALPGFARLDGAESAKSFVSSFSLVLTAGLLIAALLAPLAVPAVTFVYGARWLRSAGALGVLAVFGAMRIVFDLMATFLIARGGSRQVLLIQVGWVAALAPAMVVGVRAWGIVGAGIAHLTIAVIVVLPAYVLVLRRYGVSLRPLVRAATPPVAAALITGLAVWGCSKAVGGASYALAVGGSLGVVAYLLLLFRWLRGRLSGGLPAPAEA